ncbi:MAG: ABC transporter ATP-binding protein [Nitrososphaerota archaeon]|nr:ABC transporter ATP-binding protein [Nitrososphaerota archaeon]
MGNELLSVNKLNLDFHMDDRTIRILTNVSIQIAKGESLGLMGETGSGKSLTSKSIIGLIPKTMEASGEVTFAGTAILNNKDKTVAEFRTRRIALVPQNAMTSLDPLFTIRQLMYEILGKKIEKAEREKKCREALASVELDPERVMNARPFELSGGMQQRAVIAMALIRNPELIIADEFTSALDVETQRKLIVLMNKIRREMNLSLLVISHDINVIKELCNRVAVMYLGRIVETSTIEEVLKNPKHPYTKALLAAIPRVRGTNPMAITGSVPNLMDMPNGCKFNPRCSHVMPVCRETEPKLTQTDKTLVACYLFSSTSEKKNE